MGVSLGVGGQMWREKRGGQYKERWSGRVRAGKHEVHMGQSMEGDLECAR